MPLSSLYLTTTLAVVLILWRWYSSQEQRPDGTKKIPSPPGLPLVGHLPFLPPKHSWLKFKEWSDQYGSVIKVNLAGQTHIIVSSERIANELLRDRGSIYSARQQLPAATVLLGDNLRMLFWPPAEKWKDARKFAHSVLHKGVARTYADVQTLESTKMLNDLIRAPHSYETWFERYSAGVIFRLAFGKSVKTGKEKAVREIFRVVHNVERVASPGAYAVDLFPSLMYLPAIFAPFKRELKAQHIQERTFFRSLLEDVRQAMKQGTAPDCWEKSFIEQEDQLRLTTDEGAYVVGTMFEAGAGTTASALMSWLLCMVLHPKWYKKMQAEIDKVCPTDRLPTLDDVPDLPMVRAAVKETLRWRPVTAGGLPHMLTRDDVYDGFYLPAGSVVHPNQWAIHRDPELYPDADYFKPERWLEESYPTYKAPLTTYPNLQNFSAFGFGRRICSGQNVAEQSLNLLTARMAWACNITTAVDSDGKEIEVPLYDYTSGFNVQPKLFDFDLKVRDQARQEVIKADLAREAAADTLAVAD